MSKITHFAKIKEGHGINYYLKGYHITASKFSGVDEDTASYLRNRHFEVITKNQHDKLTGKAPKEDPKKSKEE